MKRFHYSLQRVLDVRDAVVSRCEAHLADSERDLQALGQQRNQCDEAVQAAAGETEQALGHAPVTGRECIFQRAWYHHLVERLRSSARAERTQQGVVLKRRESLRKAMTDRRVMESMSRRERQEWMLQVREAERKAMDEAAASVFLRNARDPRERSGYSQTEENQP